MPLQQKTQKIIIFILSFLIYLNIEKTLMQKVNAPQKAP